VLFHQMESREDLLDGEQKIESFLTDLAVNKNVSKSTQNQAMNADVYLLELVRYIYSSAGSLTISTRFGLNIVISMPLPPDLEGYCTRMQNHTCLCIFRLC
jgi:hypothetical protein